MINFMQNNYIVYEHDFDYFKAWFCGAYDSQLIYGIIAISSPKSYLFTTEVMNELKHRVPCIHFSTTPTRYPFQG